MMLDLGIEPFRSDMLSAYGLDELPKEGHTALGPLFARPTISLENWRWKT